MTLNRNTQCHFDCRNSNISGLLFVFSKIHSYSYIYKRTISKNYAFTAVFYFELHKKPLIISYQAGIL